MKVKDLIAALEYLDEDKEIIPRWENHNPCEEFEGIREEDGVYLLGCGGNLYDKWPIKFEI